MTPTKVEEALAVLKATIPQIDSLIELHAGFQIGAAEWALTTITSALAEAEKDATINGGCPEEAGDRIAVHVREVTTHPTPSPGPQGGGEVETIAVSDLARILDVKGAAVIRSLMTFGVMATLNQRINMDTAELVVKDMKAATPPQPEAQVSDAMVAVIHRHCGKTSTLSKYILDDLHAALTTSGSKQYE